MKLGTLVRTSSGTTGTINRRSDRFGCRMYRVSGVDGSLGTEAWFELKYLKAA